MGSSTQNKEEKPSRTRARRGYAVTVVPLQSPGSARRSGARVRPATAGCNRAACPGLTVLQGLQALTNFDKPMCHCVACNPWSDGSSSGVTLSRRQRQRHRPRSTTSSV